jgi:CRISPR-associated protein (TIGR03986 family)
MASGKLVAREFKKGKAVHIAWTNAKGNSREEPAPPAQLARDLATLAADKTKIAQLDGVEVDFEEVGGKPLRIRRKGEPWQAPAPPSPPARPQQHGQSRGPARQPAASRPLRTAPGEFHNPYNFIPAPPRVAAGPLADARPCGHERYHADRYSGTIAVRLTTVTPLLLADASRATEANNGHKTLPVRIGPDGRAFIPPTSIKGMLRSAFEAVTNSRFGVFAGHDERLAYRAAAQEGLALVPVIVENGMITLQRGTSQRVERGQAQHAAWLPRYEPGRGRPLSYAEGGKPEHGDEAWCWLSRETHPRRGFQFWWVRKIARTEAGLGTQPQGGEYLKAKGRVCVTNRNINRKHDERFFFEQNMPVVTIPLSDDVKRGWRELIRNYQAMHQDELAVRRRKGEKPDQYLGNEPGRTAWSRHVYEKDAENLDGQPTLCHALVRQEGGQYVVEALYPVMISRKLYDLSPEALLRATGGLEPATSIEKLSPADRVFGWVSQSAAESDGGFNAYRGNLRIGPVTCQSDDAVETFPGLGLPLAILGQPKPQQGRFYVGTRPDGMAQQDGLGKLDAGYGEGKRLRGRKVYPHHRDLPPDHWSDPLEDRTQVAVDGVFQEYRRPRGSKGERDTQNRSITGWVRPGQEFTFEIHVTNLSPEELGALLWILRVCEGSKPGHLRLGGGKPLGFGSVALELDTRDSRDACQIMDGRFLGASYRSLATPDRSSFDPESAIAAFKKAAVDGYASQATAAGPIETRFEQLPFIRAFLVAARGFEDGLPIHYPRARQPGQSGRVPPHREGQAYEWFVANDREGRDAGPHAALPDLADDRGLPMLDAPNKR